MGKTKVGVIGAMDMEVEALCRALENPRITTHVGMEFHEGVVGDTHAVIVQCNVGMVNAALCAQALIERFGVTHVINTGVAGSLDASINIGDVVIASDAVNHLMDVCNLGYEPGQTPGMSTLAFPIDAQLHERIARAARATADVGIHVGRVASGDRFVRDDADKRRIAGTLGALCCEMEGAAIAQACYLSGTPCAIVRVISDKADGSDAIDYPVFEAKAAADCAAIVESVLRGWKD